MYKILINSLNGEIIATGKTFKHQLEDASYLVDGSYGIGIHPEGVYEVIDVTDYVEPNKYLYENGEIKLNPRFVPHNQDEIDALKLMVAELALNATGGTL